MSMQNTIFFFFMEKFGGAISVFQIPFFLSPRDGQRLQKGLATLTFINESIESSIAIDFFRLFLDKQKLIHNIHSLVYFPNH